MLNPEDNEILCRVGPGTYVGEMMRQYWIPALRADELPSPDCPPLRLQLLSEDLIAFRTTSGAVGLMQNACPHRGASMFFGRNEEEGLRCVYHGWKFDTTGACVDMPSEPAESNFRSKVRARAYQCIERNGIVWTYMGSREVPPSLPDLEVNIVPDTTTRAMKVLRYCNWMQSLEGDIDTSHLSFLHLGSVKPEDAVPGSFDYYGVRDKAPRYDVIDTPFGVSYGAYRPAEPDSVYWRVANYLFPFYTMIPSGTLGNFVHVRAWVPVDDEHTMFWGMNLPRGQVGPGRQTTGRPDGAGSNGSSDAMGSGLMPDTSDWLGHFRLVQRAENDYLIDREAQRTNRSFTGIAGIHQQDQAVTESMGSIYGRNAEHLGTSDAMIIRTRRRIIRSAVALRTNGVIPPGVDEPRIYRARSGSIILPQGADWQTSTEHLRMPQVEAGMPALTQPSA